jgi:hypothetical protein
MAAITPSELPQMLLPESPLEWLPDGPLVHVLNHPMAGLHLNAFQARSQQDRLAFWALRCRAEPALCGDPKQ